MSNNRASQLLTLPVAGLAALILFEIKRAIGSTAASELPPDGLLIGMICVAALPVILLSLGSGAMIYWTSLVIAVLMALFHLLHIVEHAAASDFALTILIAGTMFVPSAAAAYLLWTHRDAPGGS